MVLHVTYVANIYGYPFVVNIPVQSGITVEPINSYNRMSSSSCSRWNAREIYASRLIKLSTHVHLTAHIYLIMISALYDFIWETKGLY